MALAEVPAAPPKKKGETCWIAQLREQLDDDDLATLAGWLATKAIPAPEIARRLQEADCHIGDGRYVSSFSIARHRRGDCQCDR